MPAVRRLPSLAAGTGGLQLQVLLLCACAVAAARWGDGGGEEGQSWRHAASARRQLQTAAAALPSCNWMNEQSTDWLSFESEGAFPDRRLASQLAWSGETAAAADGDWLPFHRQAQLLLWNESVTVVESSGDGTQRLRRVELPGFASNHLSHAKLKALLDPDWPPKLTGKTLPVFHYLVDVQERSTLLRLHSQWPQGLVTDGQRLAWTERCALETLGASAVARTAREAANQTSAARFCVQLTSLAGTNSSSDLPQLPLPATAASADRVSQLQPAVWAKHAAVVQFDHDNNASSVWMLNQHSGLWEMLHTRSSSLNYWHVQFSPNGLNWTAVSNASSPRWQDVTPPSTALWLATAQPMQLAEDGRLQPQPSAAAAAAAAAANGSAADWADSGRWQEEVAVQMLSLPARQFGELLPADWAADNLTRLHDARIGGRRVFLIVSDAQRTRWRVHVWDLEAERLEIMHATDSAWQLAVADVSQGTLALWQAQPAGRRLLVLSIAGDASAAYHSTLCEALPQGAANSSRVPFAALYGDILLWADVQAADGDGSAALLLQDLNKDNDLLIDAIDRFPLQGTAYWDSDNDGIGDSGDLIAAGGACLTEARGSCLSDYVILYSLWAAFALLLAAGTAAAVRVYRSQLQQAWAQASVLAGDLEMESADAFQQEELELRIQQVAQEIFVSSNPRVQGMMTLLHGVLLLLSLVSMALAILPVYELSPLPLRVRLLYAWADMFLTLLFCTDLAVRGVLRDIAVHPTWRSFLLANWVDVLALYTELPGITQFVGDTVSPLWSLVRLLVMLKVFRTLRVYRKLVRQEVLLTMMVRRPGTFLSLFLVAFVIAMATMLKMLEQREGTGFTDLGEVIWFSVVTATTVGYGDRAPRGTFARLVAASIMLLGVGLIGTLSANIAESIMSVGKAEQKQMQLFLEDRQRQQAFRPAFRRLSAPWNPLLACMGELFVPQRERERMGSRRPLCRGMSSMMAAAGATGKRGSGGGRGSGSAAASISPAAAAALAAVGSVRGDIAGSGGGGGSGSGGAASTPGSIASSILSPDSGQRRLSWASLAPSARAMAQRRGSIPRWPSELSLPVGTAAELTRGRAWWDDLASSNQAERGSSSHRHEADLLLAALLTEHGGRIRLPLRLSLLLQSFRLHETMGDFAALLDSLQRALFTPPRRNELYIEKLMALHTHVSAPERETQVYTTAMHTYQLSDPIDAKFIAIEAALREHRLHNHIHYQLLLDELCLLALHYDRTQAALWAIANLRIADGTLLRASMRSPGFRRGRRGGRMSFSRYLSPERRNRRADSSATDSLRKPVVKLRRESVADRARRKLSATVAAISRRLSVKTGTAAATAAEAAAAVREMELSPTAVSVHSPSAVLSHAIVKEESDGDSEEDDLAIGETLLAAKLAADSSAVVYSGDDSGGSGSGSVTSKMVEEELARSDAGM